MTTVGFDQPLYLLPFNHRGRSSSEAGPPDGDDEEHRHGRAIGSPKE
jgi:hypothetical protein